MLNEPRRPALFATHLHLGFEGTMNALFLKDLAEKTHAMVDGFADGQNATRSPRRSSEGAKADDLELHLALVAGRATI